MSLQYTKNLLNFWHDKFSQVDFDILVNCVDKITGNQKIGNNKFLLIKSDDHRLSAQLIMTIRNIVGNIHCQFLYQEIDTGNYRTKLFTSTNLQSELYERIKEICSSEYTQLTHTNASIICTCNYDIQVDKSIEMRAIIINM